MSNGARSLKNTGDASPRSLTKNGSFQRKRGRIGWKPTESIDRITVNCTSSRRHNGSRSNEQEAMNILTVNLLFSTFVFWVAARIY
ncbi:MAG TPA: hypothetical protein VF772_11130, partial [Terriglobales bacterium]